MQSFEVTYKQYCTHAITELDSIYSMHKDKQQQQQQQQKQQQKTTKNKNEQKYIYVYYKIDLTQVLKVRLEVTPLKSLGREFQSFAPVYSNDFLYQFVLGR